MKAIVIEVPGLHLGYLGCYGNDWVDTPNLDRLAAEGVVFDQHYADCPGGEICSAVSGRYSFPLPTNDSALLSPATEQVLSSVLTDEAIPFQWIGEPLHSSIGSPSRDRDSIRRAFIQVAAGSLDFSSPTRRGLVWLVLPGLTPPWQVPAEHLDAYFAQDLREHAEDDEGAVTDEEMSTPWLDPPTGPLDGTNDSAWRRLQHTYAAVVTHLDHQLGVLLADLDKHDPANAILVIVTSHRGLALGEHGIIGECRPWLHDELIHLPLIVRLPGKAEAGRRVAALTQPVDLLPTLLRVFGAMPQAEMHGHDLMPLMTGQAAKVRDYACAGLRQGERIEWALRTLDWGLIVPVRQSSDDPPRSVQLYVKPDDRWEVNDLRTRHMEYADQLEQTVRAFVTATRAPGPLRPPPLPAE